MVSKGPICDWEMVWVLARAADRLTSDDTLCRSTINDPLRDEASRLRNRRERVSGRRRIVSAFCRSWVAATLLLSAGCAPAIDEDARLAGIGTVRAARAPNPIPIPRFTAESL